MGCDMAKHNDRLNAFWHSTASQEAVTEFPVIDGQTFDGVRRSMRTLMMLAIILAHFAQ